MAIHNVTDSALLVKKSRKTIQRYIANGKLTVTRDQSSNPQIDTAELIRVFGKLSQVSQKKIIKKSHDVAPELSQVNNDVRIDKLLSAVERLEKVVEKQSEQIAGLLQLEHKPVDNQQAEAVHIRTSKESLHDPEPTPPTVDSYLDNMSFLGR
tara:strand:+ start:76 stop:534 length:459 start_codon:yes stop_codon:yes gene_type:complete